MYLAVKPDAMTQYEVEKIIKEDDIERLLAKSCDFTNRVIDPVFGFTEMAASIPVIGKDGEDYILTVNYLVDSEECEETEDLGDLDYSNYTFEIQ